VGSATFDALDFPMFSGILFLILGLTGAYLGIMRRESSSLPAPPEIVTVSPAGS